MPGFVRLPGHIFSSTKAVALLTSDSVLLCAQKCVLDADQCSVFVHVNTSDVRVKYNCALYADIPGVQLTDDLSAEMYTYFKGEEEPIYLV